MSLVPLLSGRYILSLYETHTSTVAQVRLAFDRRGDVVGRFVRTTDLRGIQLIFRSGCVQLRRYHHHPRAPGTSSIVAVVAVLTLADCWLTAGRKMERIVNVLLSSFSFSLFCPLSTEEGSCLRLDRWIYPPVHCPLLAGIHGEHVRVCPRS